MGHGRTTGVIYNGRRIQPSLRRTRSVLDLLDDDEVETESRDTISNRLRSSKRRRLNSSPSPIFIPPPQLSPSPEFEPLPQVSPPPEASRPRRQLPLPRSPLLLGFDTAQAIYRRYISARDLWYESQPAGIHLDDQAYRKAKGLSLQYPKKDYAWCLDWRRMDKRCITATGSREWTREEMNAYLDHDKGEDDRLDHEMTRNLQRKGFSNRRGLDDVWRRAEQDRDLQEALALDQGE